MVCLNLSMEALPKERLVTHQTMGGVLHASRNGLSKERRETVLKRCKANQPPLPLESSPPLTSYALPQERLIEDNDSTSYADVLNGPGEG